MYTHICRHTRVLNYVIIVRVSELAIDHDRSSRDDKAAVARYIYIYIYIYYMYIYIYILKYIYIYIYIYCLCPSSRVRVVGMMIIMLTIIKH